MERKNIKNINMEQEEMNEDLTNLIYDLLDGTMESLSTYEIPSSLPELYFPTIEEVKHSMQVVPEFELYPFFIFFANDPYKGKFEDKKLEEYKKLVKFAKNQTSEFVDYLNCLISETNNEK